MVTKLSKTKQSTSLFKKTVFILNQKARIAVTWKTPSRETRPPQVLSIPKPKILLCRKWKFSILFLNRFDICFHRLLQGSHNLYLNKVCSKTRYSLNHLPHLLHHSHHIGIEKLCERQPLLLSVINQCRTHGYHYILSPMTKSQKFLNQEMLCLVRTYHRIVQIWDWLSFN